MNDYLRKLYSELDLLYRNISSVCKDCNDHDCEGYIWLLKEEATSLLDQNVPIVEINDSTFFIHSFEENNGLLAVEKKRPPCRLRNPDGFCSIYDSRPLVCRIYPVGFVTAHNEVLLVIHKDCKFSRVMTNSDKEKFIGLMVDLLKQVPQNLLVDIYFSYIKVDEISSFPEGPNTFEVIMPLQNLIHNGGE